MKRCKAKQANFETRNLNTIDLTMLTIAKINTTS